MRIQFEKIYCVSVFIINPAMIPANDLDALKCLESQVDQE